MPGMRGTEALRAIKEIAPGIGTIILTGYGSKDVAVEALKGRADDYIEKPLGIGSLRESVENLLETGEKKEIDTLEVKDINSDEVRNYIKAKNPQLVVVSGAPILKQRIIEAAEGRIINLHPGFAPQYRGRYGCFWPIYNHEPELVGATVHYVDSGIDTGAILIQQQVDYYTDDTLKIITYRQHLLGGDLLIKCLTRYDALAANAYHKTDCANKNYLAPGLTHYLSGMRWLRKTNGDKKYISASLKQEERVIAEDS